MKPILLSTILLLLLLSCKKSDTTHIVTPPASWHLVASKAGMILRAVNFVNSEKGLVVGSVIKDDGSFVHGIILKTANGGNSWDLITHDTLPDLSSVFLIDTLTAYAAGTTCIIKTTDGGNTWSTVFRNHSFNPESIYFPGKDTGYAVGISGAIVRTVNGGQSWEFQQSHTNCQLTSVYFTNNQTGFAVGYFNQTDNFHGLILKTTNAGATWDSIPYVGEAMPSSVVFTSPDVGYISGMNSVLKTTDGGTNWTASYPFPMCSLGPISFLPGSPYGFMLNSCGNIVKTIDGGETWSDVGLTTKSSLMSLCWVEYDTGYAVGWEHDSNTGTIYKWY
ncbi:MAG: hypothetical protein HXX13_03205 [Bacteroidetes bacterium]|nr:hypothetical protein [Bacteroidota bacterium]